MLRDTNSRSAISAMVRCVWRYGSSRSSAGLSGELPVAPIWALAARTSRNADTRSTRTPERRAVDQDVVDLAQQVTSGSAIGQGQVDLGEL